jgi:hypothetical protein
MLTDADPESAPALSRVDRAIVLGVLAIRAGYCSYAVLVTVVNFAGYARPVLAAVALLAALASSAIHGYCLWLRKGLHGMVAVSDTAVAVLALVLVSSALSGGERAGSLNWALAYAVGCAIWLGLGRSWREMLGLASALGLAYAATVLAGGPRLDAAQAVTAFVNAISPPIFFGTAVAVFGLVRGIAEQTDATHAVERGQRREAAALVERQRMFQEVHKQVVTTLELIADGQVPATVIRARARSEAGFIRQIFSPSQGIRNQPDLRARLAGLTRRKASQGWAVELIDEELEREPAPGMAEALCEACEALLHENGSAGGGHARIRVLSAEGRARLMIRLSGTASVHHLALDRARARIAEVSGCVELKAALQGETRVMMEVAE